ncbi:extracellular solute-binding protein [Roseisalinus antarcticus]|uniref:extracellular solute-binding protein n=1 Tax=Roseisalinus antarcticus TaxID=254357 RepID=UPI00117A2FBC|nr:extracellular solute-binding protein [Roseisalinus antarcticus]
MLADFYNLLHEEPHFPDAHTANEAKYASTPAALREGGERLQEAYETGHSSEDFAAADYAEGLAMVANGDVAHCPMLTFAVGSFKPNHPDQMEDVGVFDQPGDDPDANGLTVWVPGAFYVSADTEYPEIVRDFLNFVASPAACEIMTETLGVMGPYLVEGCDLPDVVPDMVADMLPYFEEAGRTAPAVEFLSPIKGPALEQLTVEVGSPKASCARSSSSRCWCPQSASVSCSCRSRLSSHPWRCGLTARRLTYDPPPACHRDRVARRRVGGLHPAVPLHFHQRRQDARRGEPAQLCHAQ